MCVFVKPGVGEAWMFRRPKHDLTTEGFGVVRIVTAAGTVTGVGSAVFAIEDTDPDTGELVVRSLPYADGWEPFMLLDPGAAARRAEYNAEGFRRQEIEWRRKVLELLADLAEPQPIVVEVDGREVARGLTREPAVTDGPGE